MSNLIYRDELLGKIKAIARVRSRTAIIPSDVMFALKEVCDTVKTAPTIAPIEVVRCGECIHSTRSPFGHPVLRWCPLRDSHRSPDWFCADGRREKG